jgi:hypothetical protein
MRTFIWLSLALALAASVAVIGMTSPPSNARAEDTPQSHVY